MRKSGASYTQIKERVKVSKSTLSIWLREYPLSQERIRELRDWSEQRIERCRQTKARTKASKLARVSQEVAKRIGTISDRELFLIGLALYWGEGTKAAEGRVCMTNSDPAVLTLFLAWLRLFGDTHQKLKVKLHLYTDMNIRQETQFWSRTLRIPVKNFYKPYVKTNVRDKPRNYRGRFGHGTCNVMLLNKNLYDQVMAGITYIGAQYQNGFPDTTKV